MKWLVLSSAAVIWIILCAWGASAFYYYSLGAPYDWRSVMPWTILWDYYQLGLDDFMRRAALFGALSVIIPPTILVGIALTDNTSTHKGNAEWATQSEVKKAGLR